MGAYEGNTDELGEDFQVEHNEDGPRPFRCYLDVGIARTSTGARVFGFLKEEEKLDSELVHKYIHGGHVSEYMEELQEDEPEKYKQIFGKYIAEGLEPDDIEEMYEKVHEAIREDPSFTKKERKFNGQKKARKTPKLTLDERKANLKLKVEVFKSA